MIKKLEEIQKNISYFIGYPFGHNKNLNKIQEEKLTEIENTLSELNSIKKLLNQIYLEYVNEYLTIDYMAEKEEISKEDLKTLIEICKKY